MKKVLLLLIITAFIFSSCTNENNFVEPKGKSDKYTIITLPEPDGLGTETKISVSEKIVGLLGGDLEINKSYTSHNRVITVKAKETFLPLSFLGTKTIKMTSDDDVAGLEFSPSMSFLLPVFVNLTFTGLDLRELGITSQNIKFAFVDDNGLVDLISSESISVNFETGTISVKNAKVSHFSRYIFVKDQNPG